MKKVSPEQLALIAILRAKRQANETLREMIKPELPSPGVRRARKPSPPKPKGETQ